MYDQYDQYGTKIHPRENKYVPKDQMSEMSEMDSTRRRSTRSPSRSPSSSPPRRSNSPVADPASWPQRKIEGAIGKLKLPGFLMGPTLGPPTIQNPFSEEGAHDQALNEQTEYTFGGKIPESPSEIPEIRPSGESKFLKGFADVDMSTSPSPKRPSSYSPSPKRPSSPSPSYDQFLKGL